MLRDSLCYVGWEWEGRLDCLCCSPSFPLSAPRRCSIPYLPTPIHHLLNNPLPPSIRPETPPVHTSLTLYKYKQKPPTAPIRPRVPRPESTDASCAEKNPSRTSRPRIPISTTPQGTRIPQLRNISFLASTPLRERSVFAHLGDLQRAIILRVGVGAADFCSTFGRRGSR